MATRSKIRTPLRWTGGWFREPVWPREPDLAVVRDLANHHLQDELPKPIEDESLEVSFFAEGAFNKLYLISYTGHPTEYLFRVTIPVNPYFKTESEVATIAYLRANTCLPVPRILAWDSDHHNNLSYEWILMTRMPGVPLHEVWRTIAWDRKLELVSSLAGFVKEMQSRKFNSIGALYFNSTLPHQDQYDLAGNKVDFQTTGIANDGFAIGRVLDSLFFSEHRQYLPGYRGPFSSSREYMAGLIEFQQGWVRNGPIEGDHEYTKNFENERGEMLDICQTYRDAVPAFFPSQEHDSCVLHHHDLNMANILVDPATFDISGLVDWEMINIVPWWDACNYPDFMIDDDPYDEEEPPIPSYEDEEALEVENRDRWDCRLLRRHWDRVMGGARVDSEDAELKREFAKKIHEITGACARAANWLSDCRPDKKGDGEVEEAEADVSVEEEDGVARKADCEDLDAGMDSNSRVPERPNSRVRSLWEFLSRLLIA